ncbi:FAD-dependent oxidoreductase, partial [Streptomyces longispororuber]|uniref:FAD-dependent oxidoreductase n=1 Tax=Streptomyces longispororuber TaxID=68230 RepID=UPI0033D08BB7
KQWRGLAARTDKLAIAYQAALHLAGILIWTRRQPRRQNLDRLSATQYTQRRLTREVHDHLCEPFFSGGIVLGDPDKITAADMLFYGVKLLSPQFNSPKGLGVLTESLADHLPVTLGVSVTAVHTTERGAVVCWSQDGTPQPDMHAHAVVVALPAPRVPRILPQLSKEDADYLRSIPYSRTLATSFGLSNRPRETSPFVFMPRRDHPEIASMALHHNKIPGRVDNGQGLITVYPRKHFTDQWWDRDDESIAARVLAATAAVLPEIQGTVPTTHVSRHDAALVVRPPGDYAALRAFNSRRRAADPRIQLAGDYLGPSSTYGALRSGEQAAARLLEHLRHHPPTSLA